MATPLSRYRASETTDSLSDLQRTRLSRHRLIWLLPPPPPLSPVSKLSLFLSLPVCRRWSIPTNRGEGVGEEPYHMTARKPGPTKQSILFAEHCSGYWLTFSSFRTIVVWIGNPAVPLTSWAKTTIPSVHQRKQVIRGCVILPGLVWAVPNPVALTSTVYRHLSQNTHPPTLGIVAALAALGRLWVR